MTTTDRERRTDMTQAGEVRVLGVDAGGTMTDTIFIDRAGRFVIGKAQTTPEDESLGFAESAADALRYWGSTPDEAFPGILTGVFSGTSMLNRLVQRKGARVGLIVTRGMEDSLRLERGVQTWLGYSYADTFHVVTHAHNEPLVPQARVRGVGGRIDADGDEAIPLYEDDVRTAVTELLAQGIDCICVNLLFSWRNPAHEQRVRELAEEVMDDAASAVPVFLSCERCPKRRDFARLNTLLVEAYAVEPGRGQLERVRARSRDLGAGFDLRVMAGFGGTISIDSTQLVNTLVSGPIGGCVGAKYFADFTDIKNVACADIGGTSFDVALITNGEYEIKPDPDLAHFKMNFPMVRIDSIGAGTGSFVRINPISNRIEFGPDSAGSTIGVCNPGAGVETVTISDCDVCLGLINPDYFLGGQVVLDRDRAVAAVRTQIAEPLGLGVVEAAAGVVELFEDELRRQIRALVMGKGFEAADFALLGYGGGGPLHVASFAEDLQFKDVLVPSWAAGFSAFGCVCADFAYRLDRQVDLEIPPHASAEQKARVAAEIDRAWRALRERVAAEFEKSGVAADAVRFNALLRLQYLGQLNDIEVLSPLDGLSGAEDIDRILAEYERLYGKVYAASARAPELGYFVTLAIVTGSVPAEKPTIAAEPLAGPEPPPSARKAPRPVFWRDRWAQAEIYEMDRLRAGNVLAGLAIVEAPSTTLVVPEGHRATLDEHRIFHLSQVGV
jgi:acetone carboxylase, beta subunit